MKKQKEESRKARQAEKRQRRQTRPNDSPTGTIDDTGVTPSNPPDGNGDVKLGPPGADTP